MIPIKIIPLNLGLTAVWLNVDRMLFLFVRKQRLQKFYALLVVILLLDKPFADTFQPGFIAEPVAVDSV